MMRIGALAAAGALVAAVAGCAQSPHSGGGSPGRDVQAFVSTKKECREATGSPSPCAVHVDPARRKWMDDVVVIYGTADRDIEFELAAGFQFTEDGIVVDAPAEKFKCKRKQGEPRKVECKFKRDRFGVHKFTINVRRDDGTLLPPYDPFFVNE